MPSKTFGDLDPDELPDQCIKACLQSLLTAEWTRRPQFRVLQTMYVRDPA